jgi:predicted transcriptional regulator
LTRDPVQIHGSALHPRAGALLSRIADQHGTDTEQQVKGAALRLVDDLRFRSGVRRGGEQADRGELMSHDDVKARIERILQR